MIVSVPVPSAFMDTQDQFRKKQWHYDNDNKL